MNYRGTAAVVMTAVLMMACLLSGCGGGSSSSTTGSVQLLLADDPMDAQAVNVTISKVAVSKDGNGWTTLRDFGTSPVTINLLDYRYDGDGTTPDTYLLTDAPLDPGHYEQIRLILTKVEIVDKSGVTHECAMSSQDKTGLKLVGEFDVANDTKSSVLIDFNVAKSIIAEGNGTYRLSPTVKVVPVQITGSVHGTIEFKDNTGAAVAVPDGATVSAYKDDVLAGSALVGQDGTFGMNGLVEGTYVLKVEVDGFSASDTTVTVTKGSDTAVDPITASAP